MNLIRKIFIFPAPLRQTFAPVWLLAAFLLVAADIGSKKAATSSLRFHLSPSQAAQHRPFRTEQIQFLSAEGRSRIDILGEGGKYVKFRLVFNDRFAFSLGPANSLVGFLISLLAIIFLFFYRSHNPILGHPLAWLAVFSGAVGNLIDKMFVKSLSNGEWVLSLMPKKGYVTGVVDFVECIWFGFHGLQETKVLSFLSWDTWPTFNVADSLVSVGIVLLILTMNFNPAGKHEHRER